MSLIEKGNEGLARATAALQSRIDLKQESERMKQSLLLFSQNRANIQANLVATASSAPSLSTVAQNN